MAFPRFPRFRFARAALCAASAASCAAAVPAQATPFTAVAGAAQIAQVGSVTTVTTRNGAGGRSVLDWASFGVPRGTTLHFAQPDALSTAINRVTGGDPSSILGTLSSNGRLVLVNPAGIAVGPGAVIDTAAFTASTLGISRDDAIAGLLLFGSGDLHDFARTDGTLQVGQQAQVLARSGDVVLVGRGIETAAGALLHASGGDVVLAAGRTVEVTGRGLEGITMRLRAPGDRAVNLGTLKGDSVAIFAGQLRHSGLVQANSVTTAGGKVVLQAIDQAEIDGGRVEASTATRGGSVLVAGDRIVLGSPAAIDASHAGGGGEILVGGGLDGRDPRLPNATKVQVGQGVLLRADAGIGSDGGTVVVWSDGDLDFRGSIAARGGGGGARGVVQVSGPGRVHREGTVDVGGDGAGDASAPGASAGAGSGSGRSGSGDSGDPASSGPGSSDSGSGDSPRDATPRIPLAGEPTEVRAGVAEIAAETAEFIAQGIRLVDAGAGDPEILQPARGDSDARVLGAGPGERKRQRRERDLIVTGSQCRAGD